MDSPFLRDLARCFAVGILCRLAFPAPALAAADPPSTSLQVGKAAIDPEYDRLLAPRTRGFLGADGAASVPLDDGRVLWVFGDTVLGTQRGGKREGPMVHNTVAIQTRAADGPGSVEYFWDLTDRIPGAFFHTESFDSHIWYWPGTGVTVNGKTYLFLTKVTQGQSGDATTFKTTGCTLFRIQNPSSIPTEWEVTKSDLGLGDDHFNVNAASYVEGDFVYLLGYDDGPNDQPLARVAILCRLSVPSLDAPEPGKAMEFWSDDGRWLPTPKTAAPLFKPGPTEGSLQYDPVRKRYISVLIRPFTPDLCIVSAETLTGPWTDPQKVFHIPDLENKKGNHAYAARSHPELVGDSGSLLITYVVNTTDFWSMFGDMDIYYPRFVRVHLGDATPQGGSR